MTSSPDPKRVSGLDLVKVVVEAAEAKQAQEPVVLGVGEILGITDYFVICHSGVERGVRTIVDSITEKAKANGRLPESVAGQSQGRWVVLDYGEVVVHVFIEELRSFYDLERLWREAPSVDI